MTQLVCKQTGQYWVPASLVVDGTESKLTGLAEKPESSDLAAEVATCMRKLGLR